MGFSMQAIIQCVPNFSEGRNLAFVEAIARASNAARVIDYSADPDHHRMVVTFLDGPEAIRRAVLAAARKAVELIDLRKHSGAHPRIGAIDVLPLIPIQGITMGECIELSHTIGSDIASELDMPVYFYEHSARSLSRTRLPDIRKGGFERLSAADLVGELAPDAGPHRVHPSAGAVAVGARSPLAAYNVVLDSQNMDIAKAIVKKIRSGEAGLTGVRAISVWLGSQSMAQVSMNVTRPDLVTLDEVYGFVEAEAKASGVGVHGSELIGAISERFLGGASPQDLKILGFHRGQIIENWL